MMPAMKKWILITSLALLAACSKDVVEYQPLSFTRYQPIFMAVSSIEVVDEYKSPQHPPYIEHLIPYSPAEAMHLWVRDRLRTAGGNKTMQIIIHQGPVTATDTQSGSGLSFSSSMRRYDAKLEVELRIYGDGVISEASVFVSGTRSMTISASASDSERNKAFRKLIGDMMDEFNAEMEKNLFQYMGKYISFTQTP
jgi:hypothetical protein